MNRIALIFILLFYSCLIACTKTSDSGLTAYKAQAAKDDKVIADYLKLHPELKAMRTDIATDDTSGVYCIIEQPGSGNALFTNSTQVTVGYTGKLLTTGQLFAQTDSIHPAFVIGQVIRGWQLGIPLIKKDGMIRLLIPSRYAYGPIAQPQLGVPFGLKNGLPASAVLDFEIHLYDIAN